MNIFDRFRPISSLVITVRLLGALTHLLLPKHAAGIHSKGRFPFLIPQSITLFTQKNSSKNTVKKERNKESLTCWARFQTT